MVPQTSTRAQGDCVSSHVFKEVFLTCLHQHRLL